MRAPGIMVNNARKTLPLVLVARCHDQGRDCLLKLSLDVPVDTVLHLLHSGSLKLMRSGVMDYILVEEAKSLPGLRLALTAGVPGPWSEAAKALFNHHRVPFHPVLQVGGQANEALVEWTGHRNAPVAVWNDEAPRVRAIEILELAERLGEGPSLIPRDREDRIRMVGLINEIAGEQGFAWQCRMVMFDTWASQMDAAAQAANPMFKDYGYDSEIMTSALARADEFLAALAADLKASSSGFLVGDQFTAADLYWAYFSNLLQPMPHEVNPMPDRLRQTYQLPATRLSAFDPIVLEHRDRMFANHLILPLTF